MPQLETKFEYLDIETVEDFFESERRQHKKNDWHPVISMPEDTGDDSQPTVTGYGRLAPSWLSKARSSQNVAEIFARGKLRREAVLLKRTSVDPKGLLRARIAGGSDRLRGGEGSSDEEENEDNGGAAFPPVPPPPPQLGGIEPAPPMPTPHCNGQYCGPFVALERAGQCIVQEIGMPHPDTCHVPFNANPPGVDNEAKRFRLYYWWSTNVFGVRGRYNRKPLPCCVVYNIRTAFPNPRGKAYVGFIDS